MAPSTNRFLALEFLRFAAASLVFFVHSDGFEVGHFGVDIFFVISGFVMMASTAVSTRSFFLKRLIRVLPLYYLSTLGIFFIAVFYPTILNGTTADFTHLLKSLFFIPFDKNGLGHYPLVFLGWTLNYEMYFYLMFALSIKFNFKYRDLVCSIGLGFVYFCFKDSVDLPFSVYGSSLVLEFVLGFSVYRFFVDRDYFIGFFNLLILFSFLSFSDFQLERVFVAGFPSAVLVYCFLLASRFFIFPSFVSFLGGMSYSLYLLHPYIIQFYIKVVPFMGFEYFDGFGLTFSLFVISCCFAFFVWRLLELPLTAFLRRFLL